MDVTGQAVDTELPWISRFQFFQSTIAIELAVAGALLWEIRYFERGGTTPRDRQQLPDARLQLLFALVLGATVFGAPLGFETTPQIVSSSRRDVRVVRLVALAFAP